MNSAIDHRPAIVVIFVLTYVALAIGRVPGLKLNRVGIGLLGAIGMMIFSGMSRDQVAASINWPTILLLFGFFVLSSQLCLSGFYDWVALRIAGGVEYPKRFLLFLVVTTAAMSAFLNNDIICYALTPVVGLALIRSRKDAVPYLIALGVASNIGAAATPIGNSQNMLIAQVAGLSFLHYLLWGLVPVLFALAAAYFVVRLGIRENPPVSAEESSEPPPTPYPLDRAHAAKGIVILAVVIGLFFTSLPREVIVLVAAGIHLASTKFRTDDLLGLVDWPILVLFMSLFVVSGAFQSTGYGEAVVVWLAAKGFDPAVPTNLAILTAALSALINNAPAVMLLIKIVPIAHASTAYIMAVANSFGGNIIMTASVSNIIVAQQARRQGIAISFKDFARLGIPITLISIAGLVGWARLMGP